MTEEPNYFYEIAKLTGKKVIVMDTNGNNFEGIVKAVNYNYLNVILETEKEILHIRNVAVIRLQRVGKWRALWRALYWLFF